MCVFPSSTTECNQPYEAVSSPPLSVALHRHNWLWLHHRRRWLLLQLCAQLLREVVPCGIIVPVILPLLRVFRHVLASLER